MEEIGTYHLPILGYLLDKGYFVVAENALKIKKYLDRGLRKAKTDKKDVAIFIGPEGGIDKKELDRLKMNGWQSVSLGKRILRTENAGFAAAVLVLGIRGDMDAKEDVND